METAAQLSRTIQTCLLVCLSIYLQQTPQVFAEESKAKEGWIQLFNGKDLEGWVPKIRYHKLGENYGNTFRVENGILKVGYDPEAYPEFNETFGHLFYNTPFSNYVLRAEYRFVGKQVKGGPGWAFRNSGLMLHGELPETMDVDQDFPASIEVQLLGGDGKNKRSTANICTPGTHISLDGRLTKRHCTNSSSKTYHGEQWVTVEVEVRGHESLKCIMEGETVFELTHPVLDEGDVHSKTLIDANGGDNKIFGGSISLQSESHPVEYRKVELKQLKD